MTSPYHYPLSLQRILADVPDRIGNKSLQSILIWLRLPTRANTGPFEFREGENYIELIRSCGVTAGVSRKYTRVQPTLDSFTGDFLPGTGDLVHVWNIQGTDHHLSFCQKHACVPDLVDLLSACLQAGLRNINQLVVAFVLASPNYSPIRDGKGPTTQEIGEALNIPLGAVYQNKIAVNDVWSADLQNAIRRFIDRNKFQGDWRMVATADGLKEIWEAAA